MKLPEVNIVEKASDAQNSAHVALPDVSYYVQVKTKVAFKTIIYIYTYHVKVHVQNNYQNYLAIKSVTTLRNKFVNKCNNPL